MIVTENENVCYFDVDSTLIFKETKYYNEAISLDYYGETWYIRPHLAHVEFLKSLKSRGYHVIVHSANGWKHALNVVNALGLQEYVNEVKTKSIKYIDDRPVEEWFGPRIYLNE